MEVWICGQSKTKDGTVWELQGIFSTEEKAVEACRKPNYFVAPIILDEEYPEETEVMPGCYYPYYVNKETE